VKSSKYLFLFSSFILPALLFISFPTELAGQNLLSNGDFEQYNSLPQGTNQAEKCTGWIRLAGTPDYYHTDGCCIPGQWGASQPKSGMGMMGIITFWTGIVNYREYVCTALTSPLEIGKPTRVYFYLRNGAETALTGIYSDNFGFYFSVGLPVPTYPVNGVINVIPQWEAPQIIKILDDWVLMSFDFVPSAAFTHLTIGNFRDDTNTQKTANPNNNTRGAYHLIDSIVVTQNFITELSISGPQKICEGSSATLTAINGDSYSWAKTETPAEIIGTGSTLQVNPDETTTYLVYSSDDTASYVLEVVPYPVVDLGNDTAICAGQSVSYNLSQAGTTFLWQDQSILASRTFTQSGFYKVVASRNGCVVKDSVTISVINLIKPALGKDTSICAGDSLLLQYTAPNVQVQWKNLNTGNLTGGPVLKVFNLGVYVLQVSVGNCSKSDTIEVLIKPLPVLNLGNDTTLCAGKTLQLDITQPGAAYLWQDGNTSGSYTISGAGEYAVRITQAGCSKSDTMQVAELLFDDFSLGSDTSICGGEQLVLSALINGATYQWQDGSTGSSLNVSNSGLYHVKASLGSCSVSDTILVEVRPLPVYTLGADTTLCKGQILSFNFTGTGDTYQWQDASNNPVYTIASQGTYWIKIGISTCFKEDSIEVQYSECPVALEFPNVFSPNADGINEQFIPLIQTGIILLEMKIYNRWGKEVFSGNDLSNGWDGKSGGQICPAGVYFWLATFTDINNKQGELKGSLTLMN
jgi:gliding motility-associated-like protein